MNLYSQNPNILVIGGGSGVSNILMGLRRHPVSLTAIVTMFDSGGSSGLLSREFGMPPFGDLRQCLLALGGESQASRAICRALDYRFERSTSLVGHSLGNLLLAALTSLNQDLEAALDEMCMILNTAGRVVPVTLERSELCAELEDGSIVRGETNIDQRGLRRPPIRRIFLDPPVRANPRALQAALEADAIVLGPGDLYTSILPNLLAWGMVEAITSGKSAKIYICNLMTKRGETDGYRASDFADEVCQYLGYGNLDWIVANSATPSAEVLEAYGKEGAEFVVPDLCNLRGLAVSVIKAPLASGELPLRHDPTRTAKLLMQILRAETAASQNLVPFHPGLNGPVARTLALGN